MNGINTSFWESSQFKSDILIIGAGFLGSWTAYELAKKYPKAKITVVERDAVSYGASIRNAGFACFGSLSEIIADSKNYGTTKALSLVEQRYKGIQKIQSSFKQKDIEFEATGGVEILDDSLKEHCLEMLPEINNQLRHITNSKKTFTQKRDGTIFNKYEGLINSYKLLNALHKMCRKSGISFLFGITVDEVMEKKDKVEALAHNEDRSFVFKAEKALVCTNAFSNKIGMHKHDYITPQRNHIIVTSELDFKYNSGCHAMEGYIYFRPVYIQGKKHLLIGGARHIALDEENVTHMKTNEHIIEYLKEYVNKNISSKKFKVLHQWTGFMGFTPDKQNMLQHVSPNVSIACACNGMGIAMCPSFAEEIAKNI